MPAIRVFVIDDHPDITEMLCFIIDKEPDMQCVGCASSADDLAAQLGAHRPEVLVLDARMPGQDPLEALAGCIADFPGLRTIFYSGHDEPAFIEKVIDSGAWGFVSKRKESDAVLAAIRAVAAGGVVFPGRHSRS